MRVLVVSLFPPLPADSGVKIRTWSVLEALAREGHQVHLLCPADDRTLPESEFALSAVCAGTKRVPAPKAFRQTPWKQVGRMLSLPSPWPSSVARARSKDFRRAIRDFLARRAVDAIVLEQSIAAVNLPAEIRIPFVIDFHNIDHVIYQRYAQYAPSAPSRCYALLEMAKFARWEMTIATRAAAAWVCSQADASLLKPLAPALPSFVVPNVLEVESYTPLESDRPFTLLFQGGMDWYPNQDAVDFFVSSIFPRVRQAVPQAEFVVAGKKPPESLRRRLESVPRVSFTGAFADIRCLGSSAAVSVVPVRIGSGTRLKILEAAAMGKAIVSTSVGAEGLEFAPGEEILLADEPDRFAGAVVDLLKNDDRRRGLGRAARQRVEKDYTLAAMQSAVRATFELLGRVAPAKSSEAGEIGEWVEAMPGVSEHAARTRGLSSPPYPAAKPWGSRT